MVLHVGNPTARDDEFTVNWWLNYFLVHFLLHLSECLNPIFYNISSRYKKMCNRNKISFINMIDTILEMKLIITDYDI